MLRRSRVVALGVSAIVLVAACEGSPPPASVSGVLQYIGGPMTVVRNGKAKGPSPSPHAGVVQFLPIADGQVRRVPTGPDGRFSTNLPAGLYQVTGNPDQHKFWCVGGDITLRSGEAARVTVDCPIV